MAFGIPIVRFLSYACSTEAEGRSEHLKKTKKKQDVLNQL